VTLADFFIHLAIVLGPMLLLWVTSLALRDVSIVDIFWGMGFVWLSGLLLYQRSSIGTQQLFLTGVVALWGVRLSLYLLWRNHGSGEDRRYRAIRANNSPGFWWKSLFIVFGLQGVLITIVSLPVQAALTGPAQDMRSIHWLGLFIAMVGIGFESVADLQLSRFKSNVNNRGKVLDRGLWRYTRHPNYFGDFLVWWGILLLSWTTVDMAWVALGPAVMTFFLLKVSGVALLESDIAKRRPQYKSYVRRTSAFIPWIPRTG
jgi:steroid 5-alpha reductase family enzyme